MIKEIQKLREQVKENYSLLQITYENDRLVMAQYEKLDKHLSDAETSVMAIKYLEL